MITLDAIDRRILERLQHDGRLSNADLAEQVGLSSSPCWRRVKALEEAGVIKGYAALLDARTVGLSVNVFMSVSLSTQNEKSLKDFERAAAARRIPRTTSKRHPNRYIWHFPPAERSRAAVHRPACPPSRCAMRTPGSTDQMASPVLRSSPGLGRPRGNGTEASALLHWKPPEPPVSCSGTACSGIWPLTSAARGCASGWSGRWA